MMRRQVVWILLALIAPLPSCRPAIESVDVPIGDPTPPAFGPLVHDGDAVFFVGNSFFGDGERSLPRLVTELGNAVSPPVHLRVGADIVFGNTPLADFLDHPATQVALASRQYKVFVLQGEEYEPVEHKAAFHEAVRRFHRAITDAGGQAVLFMTWEFSWRPFLRDLAASYEEIGRELGIPVIPIGLVYRDCDRRPFPGKSRFWLTASANKPEGDLHQNEYGAAVNAYATFQILTGIDSQGAGRLAPEPADATGMSAYLSDMAWARVMPRLRIGAAGALPSANKKR